MVSTLRIGGAILDLSSPKVMAILNATPDSFYAPSRCDASSVLDAATRAIDAGAAILDIGGCSTRPGGEPPTSDEEFQRVYDVISKVRASFPDFPISLDTYRAEIVRKIVDKFGPVLVNDISGGQDPDMFKAVSALGLPYILCHMPVPISVRHEECRYDDLISDMLCYFADKVSELTSMGVYDIILDPNFGFAKDIAQNFQVVSQYRKFLSLGLPLMAGISRKRFVPSCAETAAVHMSLLERGAALLRVHDVQDAVSTIKIYHEISKP